MKVVAITTSQRPTRRTRSLCRDLECAIPEAVYVQRGTKNLRDTVLEALENDAETLLYISEAKGNPARITVIDISEIPPRERLYFSLGGVKLQREFSHHDAKRINVEGTLAITTSKRPVSGHVKVAEALSDLLGVEFVPRTGSLEDVLDEAFADALLVIESHPTHLGTITFYRGSEKVGPSIFYRRFEIRDRKFEI